MTPTSRAAAAALLVGSVATICSVVGGPLAGDGTATGTALGFIGVAGGFAVLLGLPVLVTGVRRGRAPLLVGYALLAAAIVLAQEFLGLTFGIVVPWIAAQGVDTATPPPALGALLAVAGPLTTLGVALLAVGFWRSAVHPRWAAAALAGATALSVAALAGLPDLLDAASTAVLFAVLAATGARALFGEQAADQRVPATA
jgi:hypothetical protein